MSPRSNYCPKPQKSQITDSFGDLTAYKQNILNFRFVYISVCFDNRRTFVSTINRHGSLLPSVPQEYDPILDRKIQSSARLMLNAYTSESAVTDFAIYCTLQNAITLLKTSTLKLFPVRLFYSLFSSMEQYVI